MRLLYSLLIFVTLLFSAAILGSQGALAATQASGVLDIVGRVPEIATVTYNTDGTSRVRANFPIKVLEGCRNESQQPSQIDMLCEPGVRPQVIAN